MLTEGRVRLGATTAEGKYAILAFIEAGEIFGELALLDSSRRDELAEAVTASTVVMLSRTVLESLMAESAAFLRSASRS